MAIAEGCSVKPHEQRGGLIELDFGEQKIVMRRKELPDLVGTLLKEMNPPELKECHALILYFGSAEDSKEFAAIAKAAMKNLRSIQL